MLREMLKRLAAGDRADRPSPEVLGSFLGADTEQADAADPVSSPRSLDTTRVAPRRTDRAREIAMNRVRRLRIHAA